MAAWALAAIYAELGKASMLKGCSRFLASFAQLSKANGPFALLVSLRLVSFFASLSQWFKANQPFDLLVSLRLVLFWFSTQLFKANGPFDLLVFPFKANRPFDRLVSLFGLFWHVLASFSQLFKANQLSDLLVSLVGLCLVEVPKGEPFASKNHQTAGVPPKLKLGSSWPVKQSLFGGCVCVCVSHQPTYALRCCWQAFWFC